MSSLRIAVAGAGYIGQAHIEAVRSLPGLELAAIVDPSDAAAAIAQRFDVPLHASLEQLIATDRPDGIVIATPNVLHLANARTCLAAGVPMLLEKPVTATLEEGEALLRDIAASDVAVLVGHHRAHSPIIAVAKEVIDSGRLGRIVAVTGSAMFFKPDEYFATAPWRREAGAGPVLLNMIHEVHNLRMLCGEIVEVQAFASNAARGFVVEDTVAINLRFASGALGSFMLSDTAASARSWEQTARENPAYAHEDDEDCYLIAGSHGSLAVPTMRLKAYPNDADRSWWKPFEHGVVAMTRDDPIRLQMQHFAQVVRGQARPRVSVHDGVANLRVTEAIAAAARSGQRVTV
jgi:predicted dehydrogenase